LKRWEEGCTGFGAEARKKRRKKKAHRKKRDPKENSASTTYPGKPNNLIPSQGWGKNDTLKEREYGGRF